MSKYNFKETRFGEHKSIVLSNDNDGTSFEVALQGATPLKFNIPFNGNSFDILDGFASPREFDAAKGARCWIMTPFANRIPGGKYNFNGKEYKLEPIFPRSEVIHGFTSYENFELKGTQISDSFIEVSLQNKKIRPGIFQGYPFSIDVTVMFKLEKNKLTIQVIAENTGSINAPFGTGWHPYFKTSDKGIEHLILTLDAKQIILIDNSYIPLQGEKAYGSITDFPRLDFGSHLPEQKRIINGRTLDNCFSNLKIESGGFSRSSIFDPENGLRITMFQKGGVTLAFSGNTLALRARKSIALEPMQFITNAFNRDELKDQISVEPGMKSVFEFGVEITK